MKSVIIGIFGLLLFGAAAIILPMTKEVKATQPIVRAMSDETALGQFIAEQVAARRFENFDEPMNRMILQNYWGLTVTVYGENNCAIQQAPNSVVCNSPTGVICAVKVVVNSGPYAGTHIFAKTCDSFPIVEPIGNTGLVVHFDIELTW
jgi:hypothetical protein